jgi:hypothetical protein
VRDVTTGADVQSDRAAGPTRVPVWLDEEIFMKCLCVLFLTAPLFAQVTLPGGLMPGPYPILLQQTFTTGMVGFTTNQTARLSVFNLNAVPPSTSNVVVPNCTVALQFFDDKGALISQSVAPNFAPGASTSFDLARTSVTSETATRAQIRGVVAVNPASAAASPAAVGNCSVVTTLEIFDATGSTVALTSDTRLVGAAGATSIFIPLP